MARYWIMVERQLEGPYEPSDLRVKPQFCADTLLCQEGDDAWQSAKEFEEIRTQFFPDVAAPPRARPEPARRLPINSEVHEILGRIQVGRSRRVRPVTARWSSGGGAALRKGPQVSVKGLILGLLLCLGLAATRWARPLGQETVRRSPATSNRQVLKRDTTASSSVTNYNSKRSDRKKSRTQTARRSR